MGEYIWEGMVYKKHRRDREDIHVEVVLSGYGSSWMGEKNGAGRVWNCTETCQEYGRAWQGRRALRIGTTD